MSEPVPPIDGADLPRERGTFWNQPARTTRLPGARHAKIMRSLRLGLPLVAAALIGVVMAWPRLEAAMAPVIQDVETPQVAGKNQLVNPKFKGLDSQNQPYVVTATHAEQTLDNRDIITMTKPTADILLNSGHHVGAEADAGTYAQGAGKLDLEGHVVMHEDEGYRFNTTKMLVDTQSREAQTDQRVTGGGPGGTIDAANGVHGYDDDEILIFNGPAKMVIFQDKSGQDKSEQDKSGAQQ